MDVTYSVGPRILDDGTNLDADIDASIAVERVVDITSPVTDLLGLGYEPGQLNKDKSPL